MMHRLVVTLKFNAGRQCDTVAFLIVVFVQLFYLTFTYSALSTMGLIAASLVLRSASASTRIL